MPKGFGLEPFIYYKDRMVLQETCHPAITKGLVWNLLYVQNSGVCCR